MHIEILVEDSSGDKLLNAVLPKLLGDQGNPHSWRVHAYKGIGRIPKNLNAGADPAKRILLDQLPRVMRGYGKTPGIDAVVVVLDADGRSCVGFLAELKALAACCNPAPITLFRIAIEEMEAWYFGDRQAQLWQVARWTSPLGRRGCLSVAGSGFPIGDWCWFRQASSCRAIERRDVGRGRLSRVAAGQGCGGARPAADFSALESVRPSVEQILHTMAAARLLDALENNLLLAPIESSVVPLPHQLYALNRAISRDRIRAYHSLSSLPIAVWTRSQATHAGLRSSAVRDRPVKAMVTLNAEWPIKPSGVCSDYDPIGKPRRGSNQFPLPSQPAVGWFFPHWVQPNGKPGCWLTADAVANRLA